MEKWQRYLKNNFEWVERKKVSEKCMSVVLKTPNGLKELRLPRSQIKFFGPLVEVPEWLAVRVGLLRDGSLGTPHIAAIVSTPPNKSSGPECSAKL